jgi:hypothetical protein
VSPIKASKSGLACALLLVAMSPAGARGAQTARLHVALRPERLGGRTTMVFSFRILPHGEQVPSPLVAMSLFYPANIGIVTSGLGLQTCAAHQLEARGRCPPNSLMGYGNALVALFFGSELVRERGKLTTWMAPVQNGNLSLLFYAEAPTPVAADLIFTGQLLEALPPFGGQLGIDVPLVPSLPEAPDAAVVEMTATIGPLDITYYARFRGKSIPYHPAGIRLPEVCPRGGFPFAATFGFQDGTQAHARTSVPCPRQTRARGRG